MMQILSPAALQRVQRFASIDRGLDRIALELEQLAQGVS